MLALTGWIRRTDLAGPAGGRWSRWSGPVVPMVRTASIGGVSMLTTYLAGHLLYP